MQNIENGGLVCGRSDGFWRLIFYIGQGAFDAECLIQNVISLCGKYLPGNYSLELVDPTEDPQRALRDQVLTFPTLIRAEPQPPRRVFGPDLTDPNRILSALGIADIVSG